MCTTQNEIKKRWKKLEERVADLEKQIQGRPVHPKITKEEFDRLIQKSLQSLSRPKFE